MNKFNRNFLSFIFIYLASLSSYYINTNMNKDKKIIENNKIVINKYSTEEKKYKRTLKRIAENIYRTDSFLRIGGYGSEKLDYDNGTLTKILEGNSDFDKYLADVNNFFNKRAVYFSHIPNIFPVKYSKYNRITSPFGDRISPLTGKLTEHKGIDIASVYHAQILSTADGIVVEHWIYHPEFGRLVIIDHGNGYRTVYAHMFKVYVHEGERVKRGQVIGLMGGSGEAIGDHLHYEVRKNGKAIDPMQFLRGYAKDKKEITNELE